MADLQDISYAIVQVAHNFGATAVVGSAIFALQRGVHASAQRKCAWVAALGWATQALSGIGFGAITYHYYAKFPDIHGLALGASALTAAAFLRWFS